MPANKLRTYCQFKTNFELSGYLTHKIPVRKRKCLTNLRISAHKLHIESGRYNNIPANERYCSLCTGHYIEDEKHFMLHCHTYATIREWLFTTLSDYDPSFNYLNDHELFIYLMDCNNGDFRITSAVLSYIDQALSVREEHMS